MALKLESLDAEKEYAIKNGTEVNVAESNFRLQKLKAETETENKITQLHHSSNQDRIAISRNAVANIGGILSSITEIQMNSAKAGSEQEKKLKRQQFNRQKALGIANATINTYEAATKELTNDPYGILRGITIAMGLASIAAIASQQYHEDSGGGGSSAMGAFSGNSSGSSGFSSPSSFSGPSVFSSGYTQQVPSGGPAFMRVAVVESDIRNTMDKVQVLQTRANMFGP